MEELENILKNYLDKGSDRIDVTAVLSLIKIIRQEQNKQLTLTNTNKIMPTGYTAGIIDGKTKDFKEYALHCERAFAVHMRDESFDSEYKAREPGDYHTKAIAKAKETLKDMEIVTDTTIIECERAVLLAAIKYHKKGIKKDQVTKTRLESFLAKAENYKPPTEKHKAIGRFMIEQIKKTIGSDCYGDYHEKEIKKTEKKLLGLNAEDIRADLRIQSTKDLAYHTKENEAELKRCRESNQWHEEFINSINS
jgi:hypothetical protein